MPNEVDSLLLDSVSPHCAEEPASLTETTCFIDGDYRDHVDACKNDCKALRDGVSSRATAAAKTESATSKCTPWSCLPCWRKKEPTKPKKEHRDVVVMPTEISGVDEPLLRTLATVASKMYAEELMASYEDGAVFTKAGGEHGEGTKALDLFKSSLACYGKVVDGIIDWSGEAEAYFTPDLTLALTLVTLTLTLILTLTCRPRSHRLLRSSSSRKTETWATYEPAPLLLTRSGPSTLSRLPTCYQHMLPASGRPPSSFSPGADLPRCWTSSMMSRSLPLSVGRAHTRALTAYRAPQPSPSTLSLTLMSL